MMQTDYLNLLAEMCARRDALTRAIENLAAALRSGALSDEPTQCVSTVVAPEEARVVGTMYDGKPFTSPVIVSPPK
jgi:hypothetical protein